jgi:predicted exporter
VAKPVVGFLARYWQVLLIIAALGFAFHKGRLAERSAQDLAAARATIARQEALARRNEEAAAAAQYNAVVRAAENDDLQRRLDAYAAELKTQSEASVAREEELTRRHDETVASYEERLRRLARSQTGTQTGTKASRCVLDGTDVERLHGLVKTTGGTRSGSAAAR